MFCTYPVEFVETEKCILFSGNCVWSDVRVLLLRTAGMLRRWSLLCKEQDRVTLEQMVTTLAGVQGERATKTGGEESRFDFTDDIKPGAFFDD